jgi:4-amino-4-deoxy-L-arabinose transferase-like glycosyltransferase
MDQSDVRHHGIPFLLYLSMTLESESSRLAHAHRPWLWVLGLTALLRLLSLDAVPLTDHTEARYAEIARLMVVLGDWLSPHVTPTEVFWAKPPLATWGQALALQLFGVSAWAARLPALLWSVGALGALAWMLAGTLSRLQVCVALVLLALSPLFFVSAGAAMTDATLSATVLWVHAAWWRALQTEGAARARAGRLLAFGLALALLTKGPAAAVLALLPVLVHATWRRHWPIVATVLRDPWSWLVCLGVALPWYVLAELKTPGFLNYFVLGEHVMRFIQPGWQGDRYGFAHAQPLGMIWLFTALAALPVLLLLLLRGLWLLLQRLVGRRRSTAHQPGGQAAKNAGTAEVTGNAELRAFALCIALVPLLLFTFAHNLIWTYAMTALPGVAILTLCCLPPAALARTRSWVLALALLTVFAWAYFFKLPGIGAENSELTLIQAYERACAGQDCGLRYQDKPPYSAYFYTAGRLYVGMPGAIGSPSFTVRPFSEAAKMSGSALLCNKRNCLFRDDATIGLSE